MSCIFYERKHDRILENFIKGAYPPFTCSCFSDYIEYYDGDSSKGEICFGFYANPKITKLIDEINESFRNIKIEVLLLDKFPYNQEYVFYSPEDGIVYDDEEGKMPSTYDYCLFTFHFNSSYSNQSKFFLAYALGQFLRGFCPNIHANMESSKIESDFINGMLEVQSTQNYGDWMCFGNPEEKRKCDRNTFNKFDNVDILNQFASKQITTRYNPSLSIAINELKKSEKIKEVS